MSAETLRKAAALIRKERGAHEFYRAVADWIEEVEAWDAEGLGTGAGGTNFPDMWDDMKFMAHTVARVYLGESA